MSRQIIRGKRTGAGPTILRGGQGGLRKITCQSCHGKATPQRQGDGSFLLVCGGCGAKYVVKKM
jgi:hypothetical protein